MSVASNLAGPPLEWQGLDLDALPVGAFRTDRGGRYLAVNARWSDLTGLPRENALGMGWIDSIHPADVDEVVAAWNGAIFTQSGFHQEYRLAQAAGDQVWIKARAMPAPGEESSGYVGVVDDVSGHVAAEQHLRREHLQLAEAREQLATILTSLEQLVFTSEVRADGSVSVIFVGPGIERLLGGPLPANDDPLEAWFRKVHPDDRAGVEEAARNPFAHDGRSREYRVLGVDGATRWISARTRVRHTPEGRVLVDGVATDVTDRHARDAEREQFAALVSSCDDLIAITTVDLRLKYLNLAGRRLVGLDSDGALGIPLAELYTASTARHLQHHAVASARHTGAWRGEGQLRSLHDGALIDVEIALLLLRDPTTRQASGFATIQRDVSNERRLGGRLHAAEQQLQTLVDSIGEVVYEATVGADGLHAVFVSRALEWILGRSLGADEDGLAALEAAVHPDDRITAQTRAVRVRNGLPDSSTLCIVRPDGEIRRISISARPRRQSDGQLTISGVIADLSDHQREPAGPPRAIRPSAAPSAHGLTNRQIEILDLFGQGYNAPQIAARLTLAVSTVRNHSQAILTALNVQSRAAALERARALGLVWAPPSADDRPPLPAGSEARAR
jgi:PAS domain S-box-containing protein